MKQKQEQVTNLDCGKEIKYLLLDGDIGAWIDELIVIEDISWILLAVLTILAIIGATPWQAPYHDMQIFA